jgi:hypothetical protein
MPRTRSVLVLTALATGLLWLAAPPSHAAAESFKVLSVDTLGCNSGDFHMTVKRANLDGGTYTVRTLATAGGLAYMNESASISVNGQSGWSLFNNFTYGPVPNQGTWPIPSDTQLRMDFSLERPVGTILYRWSLVVDGCNTGNILYNALTSRDKDRDLVPTPKDRCPSLPAARSNGCPLRDRTLTFGYDAQGKKFIGWLFAEGYPKLYAGRAVTIWKVRPGADLKIGTATTTQVGNFALAHARLPGVYCATSNGLIVATAGQVTKDTSLKLHLH